MQIKFEGSLTKEEFKKVTKLMNHPISKRMGIDADLWWIILVFIGFGLIAASMRALFVDQNISVGIFWGAVGAVVFSYGLKARTAIDKAWNESTKTKPELEGIVTEEYLEMRGPDDILQVLWTGFSGYGEIDNVVLLMRGNTGYPISARFFQSEGDWQEFQKLISSKLNVTHKVEKKIINPSTLLLGGWIIVSIIMVWLVLRAGAK